MEPSARQQIDPAPLMKLAFDHQKAGRRDDAAAVCQQILDAFPDYRQALLLLGLLRTDDPDLSIAEALFTRCRALDPQDFLAIHNLAKIQQRRNDDIGAVVLFEQAFAIRSDFAPTFNDFGVSLHKIGRHKDSIEAFDRALTLDPNFALAYGNRGRVLFDTGKPADAAASFRQEIALTPRATEAWYNLAFAHVKMHNYPEAEALLRHVLTLEPGHVDANSRLAGVLERMHRPMEAEPYCIAGARQLGVLTRNCTEGEPIARVLLIGGAGPCNLPTGALFDPRRIETISVHFLPTNAGGAELLRRLPPYDLVFNAIADADRGEEFLTQAEEFCRGVSCPVLNPPERIWRTRRDGMPELFKDIPSLAIPRTRRVTRAELTGLATQKGTFTTPQLLRPSGSHGGHDLERLDTPAALATYLKGVPFEEFYLSDFWDYQSDDSYWRKYRLVFVDRKVFPYHLAIAKGWMVHYWRADMEGVSLKQEEEAFLADYRSVFKGHLGDAIDEVGRRMDLDYAGIDCGVTRDGQVLLFEANASMLVHLNDSREDFGYKHTYVPRIFDAITEMVKSKIAAP